MKFEKFQELVRERYCDAEIFKHGEFAGNKINVAIIFTPNSRVYRYNGTYCEVLNSIGIKAIYKHDLEQARKTLNSYVSNNGKKDIFFGGVLDYSKKIDEWSKIVDECEKNYIVV